jgi:hypothetical protein
MIDLPLTPYQWKTWDCFALANYLRSQANLRPLPCLKWLYRHYTEESLPPTSVSYILNHYAVRKIGGLVEHDLLALRFGGNPEGLGTIVDGGVVFMSFERGAVWMSLADMQSRISGVWVY